MSYFCLITEFILRPFAQPSKKTFCFGIAATGFYYRLNAISGRQTKGVKTLKKTPLPNNTMKSIEADTD